MFRLHDRLLGLLGSVELEINRAISIIYPVAWRRNFVPDR